MYAIIRYSNEELEVKVSLLTWQTLGRPYTVTGYGKKIPTWYKVKRLNRWYRVYATCISNVTSEYIVVKGIKLFLTLYV